MTRIQSLCLATLGAFLFASGSANATVNEADSNFDGKPDQWEHVDANGQTTKIEHDGNFEDTIRVTAYSNTSSILAPTKPCCASSSTTTTIKRWITFSTTIRPKK